MYVIINILIIVIEIVIKYCVFVLRVDQLKSLFVLLLAVRHHEEHTARAQRQSLSRQEPVPSTTLNSPPVEAVGGSLGMERYPAAKEGSKVRSLDGAGSTSTVGGLAGAGSTCTVGEFVADDMRLRARAEVEDSTDVQSSVLSYVDDVLRTSACFGSDLWPYTAALVIAGRPYPDKAVYSGSVAGGDMNEDIREILTRYVCENGLAFTASGDLGPQVGGRGGSVGIVGEWIRAEDVSSLVNQKARTSMTESSLGGDAVRANRANSRELNEKHGRSNSTTHSTTNSTTNSTYLMEMMDIPAGSEEIGILVLCSTKRNDGVLNESKVMIDSCEDCSTAGHREGEPDDDDAPADYSKNMKEARGALMATTLHLLGKALRLRQYEIATEVCSW